MPEGQTGGSEPIMTSAKRKRGLADLITVLVALIIIGVVIANVMKTKQAEAPTEESSMEEVEETEEMEEIDEEKTTMESEITAFFISGSEFEEKTRAETTINSSQGKQPGSHDYEYIVSGVVRDETNADVVYFATQSNNPLGNFVGVYQFNTKTYNWQRFYKNSFLPEGDLGPKELRVIGKQARDLILLVDRLDRDQEDCESFWLIGTQAPYELVTLNLDTPLNGLHTYELPASVRAEEEARVQACLAQ